MENHYMKLGNSWLDTNTGELLESPGIIILPDEDEDPAAMYSLGLGSTMTISYIYA